MAEVLFRCDYDGHLQPLNRVVLGWRWVEDLEDGREVWKAGVFCGEYCKDQAAKYDVAVGS